MASDYVLRRLKIATGLCVTFLIVEVIGGLLSQSLAILSDAAHLFADLAAFVVAIVANYLASLPSTSDHTYGLKRTESLAALLSMLSLVLVCVGLALEALRRLYWHWFDPSELEDVDGKLMSQIALIGVAVNVALAFVLGEHHVHLPGHDHECDEGHDHSHSHSHSKDDARSSDCGSHNHSHSHAHSDGPFVIKTETDALLPLHQDEVPPPRQRNVNLHAAYIHVLGDLAQSVSVLIAGLFIWYNPEWTIIDPICTLGFCALVFYSTLGVLRSSIAVLLEAVPAHISWEQVHHDLSHIDGLSCVHDLHIWCIADGVPCISLHASATDVAGSMEAIKSVCQKHKIGHITAQVQPVSIGDCITCGDGHVLCA